MKVFKKDVDSNVLHAYVDVDFANDKDDRKSRTCCIAHLGNGTHFIYNSLKEIMKGKKIDVWHPHFL